MLGEDAFQKLSNANVLVVGIGGVGSWCAEALVRSGLGNIAIMDGDVVEPSNINRQLQATLATIGMHKCDALAAHFTGINPDLHIEIYRDFFDVDTEIDFSRYSAVVDAIDDIKAKALLIRRVTAAGVPLFSAMGAARKTDPSKVALAPFSKVQGCPLARALRHHFRHTSPTESPRPAASGATATQVADTPHPIASGATEPQVAETPRPIASGATGTQISEGVLPEFTCVYSPERPTPTAALGSLMPVTATFGTLLASALLHKITGL